MIAIIWKGTIVLAAAFLAAALLRRRSAALRHFVWTAAFAALLEAAGASVVRAIAFPDHCPYDAVTLRDLAAAAAGAEIVVTEKDLVKLAGRPGTSGVRALRIALEVEDERALLDCLAVAAGLDLQPE